MTAAEIRKRLGAAALGFLLCFPTVALAAKAKQKAAPAPPLPVVHGPYLVADVMSGRVIEEFDALRPWYPASTTKLMTLYAAFRAVQAGEIRLDSEILYSKRAAAEPASKMGFKPGTRMTLDHALKMMMVKSANDIAVVVAEAVGGSIAGFAERMNSESQRLGMTRSHWVNPNGLPEPKQVTSARDMALLGRALLVEFPQYRDYYKLPAIQIGDKVLKNFNALLEHYPGATGMKTGFICASGYNLVASARRGNRELLTVVFGEYGGKARTERAAELLDAGFAAAPAATAPPVMLAGVRSGENYDAPLDMRPYVCGPRRATTASEANEDGADGPDAAEASHLTLLPIYLGPPVVVSAVQPAKYGEPGFVARLPKARPDPNAPNADVMNAFAPIGSEAGAPPAAEAIGAAAGGPSPLNNVAPQ